MRSVGDDSATDSLTRILARRDIGMVVIGRCPASKAGRIGQMRDSQSIGTCVSDAASWITAHVAWRAFTRLNIR